MSAYSSLRLLQAHELVAVSGGDIIVNGPRPSEPIDPRVLDALRFNFNLVTMEDLHSGTNGSLDTDEDSDRDGIPNWEDDPIVVDGNPEVQSAWENWAAFHVDLLIYGSIGVAALTGIGLPLEIALAVALGGGALAIHRQAAIDFLADLHYELDAGDGILNGHTFALPPSYPQAYLFRY